MVDIDLNASSRRICFNRILRFRIVDRAGPTRKFGVVTRHVDNDLFATVRSCAVGESAGRSVGDVRPRALGHRFASPLLPCPIGRRPGRGQVADELFSGRERDGQLLCATGGGDSHRDACTLGWNGAPGRADLAGGCLLGARETVDTSTRFLYTSHSGESITESENTWAGTRSPTDGKDAR